MIVAIQAGFIGTRISIDQTGFSRIFLEKSVKIQFHPSESAFQSCSLNRDNSI